MLSALARMESKRDQPLALSLRATMAIVVASSLALSGCAVGPNFKAPAAPNVSGYLRQALPAEAPGAPVAGGQPMRLISGADVPAEWWTLYNSPPLNALVERALKNSPDLEAAQAALRQAREAYYAQRGAVWPSVAASYNLTRQQAPATPAPPLSSNQDLFTLHTAQVSVTYPLDVFGGVRRQTESARAQAESQRFQTEAAYLSLTTNVVVAAFQAASLGDQLAATNDIVEDNRKILEVMRRQFAAGQISRADVAAQETALALAQQLVPVLEKQLAQQQDLIAVLTGDLPSQSRLEHLDLAAIALPRDLPVSLPAQLVDQRPDVRAAAASLHSASAQLGVAIANRLPNLTLSADAGGAATRLSQLFTHGNGFWSLSGDLVQPVFQGGALLHRQRGAQAALDQAKAQYRSTVLSAFQNVADTLYAIQADSRALQAAFAAEQTAAESLAIAKKQLTLGQVSGFVVITADQAYAQTRLALIQAEAGRFTDTAALFQALGGGWWGRTETAATR